MNSKNHTRRRTLVFLSKKFLVAVGFTVALFISSCGPILNKDFVYKGPKYPPHTGELKVYWKDHGVPADPNSYVLIGTVSGRTAACGFKKAAFHKELHDWIKGEAAKAGGNGVIIYCGELGTVGECYCYGDIIHFK